MSWGLVPSVRVTSASSSEALRPPNGISAGYPAVGWIARILACRTALAAADVREGCRVDAEGTQVARIRAAVAFDGGGSSIRSTENGEGAANETHAVLGGGSHLFARFRFLFDEQKMGSGRCFCNAQNLTPAMQRKHARER
ncbi:hypothetical protein [Sinorhizobium mexicanum]|uniref:hypothetical protein n=1 Tax=Sinorhizobium mexicanum TaxID=375549 RepID=UPI0015DF1D16|nr:hypothetical protein [Sinorhizobium mexicanum]MBP1886263.1 hypothetical protein [Sinorhizobium mexicanum]